MLKYMDPQNQEQPSSAPKNINSPDPQVPPTIQNNQLSLNHSRVLKPSDTFVKEMQSVASTSPSTPVQPPVTPPIQPVQQSPQVPNPQAPSPQNIPGNAPYNYNPNSIYPEAKTNLETIDLRNDVNLNNSADQNNREPIAGKNIVDTDSNSPTSLSFKNGYRIGTSIFFMQLIAGIVVYILYILASAITQAYHGGTTSLIINLAIETVSLAIMFYTAYWVINSNNVPWPFWLTVFGSTVETVIGFFSSVLYFLLVYQIISSGVISKITTSQKLNLLITIFVFGILIAGEFYLIKISYGAAFSVFGKLRDVTKIKVLCVTLAITVTIITFLFSGTIFSWIISRFHPPVPRQTTTTGQQITINTSFEPLTYDNGKGIVFKLKFYRDYTIKPAFGSTNGAKELAAIKGVDGKAPLTMLIDGGGAQKQQNNQQQNCNGTATAVTAYNSYINQNINACDIKLQSGQSTSYIAAFNYTGKSYVVVFGQDLDFRKGLSSRENAQTLLASTGLDTYNSAIKTILASVQPL